MPERRLLTPKNGKFRWKCEHCLATISCDVDHAGKLSPCPHCGEEITFPTQEDYEQEKKSQPKLRNMIFVALISAFSVAAVKTCMSSAQYTPPKKDLYDVMREQETKAEIEKLKKENDKVQNMTQEDFNDLFGIQK